MANKEKCYMVIGAYKNSIRDNLEIIDYDLTYEQAQKIVKDLTEQHASGNIEGGDDWELDIGYLKIFEQKERI